MTLNELTAISPIDGRYRAKTDRLSLYFSEYALIRYRVRVECEYFVALMAQMHPELTFDVTPIWQIAIWEMNYEGEKVLVVHNVRSNTVTVPISGYSTENELVSNGSISKANNGITMGPYSSVVYKQ